MQSVEPGNLMAFQAARGRFPGSGSKKNPSDLQRIARLVGIQAMGQDEQLFERFRNDGDIVALGELFDRTAPTMLRVALHLARDPGSAEDLVQSTFVRAIEVRDEWNGRRPVLPWLFGILHNRARQARRRDQRNPDPVRLARPAPSDPSCAAEYAEFDAAVDAAIAELPGTYRPVLRLHLAYGHAPAEIAHALELPAGTVRSQLARGLEKLRKLLPLGFAGAAAMTLSTGRGLASVKLAVLGRAAATVPVALTQTSIVGVALVKTKTILAATVLTLLGTAVWLSRPTEPEPGPTNASTGSSNVMLGADSPPSESSLIPMVQGEPGRVAASLPSSPASGSLHIRCLWEDDGSQAGGVLVTVMGPGRLGGLLQWDATTDVDGTVLMADLPAGDAKIVADRGGLQRVVVVAGNTTDVELVIPAGVNLRGRVIDEHGLPIPNARVWLSIGARNYVDGRHVARVDPAGRFDLRSVEPDRFVSADAPGYRAAVVQPVRGSVGELVKIELVLHGAGATLVGTVVDANRSAVVRARVQVGSRPSGSFAWSPAILQDYRPPQMAASDARGEFRVDGLEPGGQVHVWIRASGWSAWTELVALREVGETVLTIQLERGARIGGRATDGGGNPVARAYVTYRHGFYESLLFDNFGGPDWAYNTVFSDSDGSYRLQHVPSGTIRLVAGKDRLEVRGQVTVATDQVVAWDPVFVEAAIHGRVVDEGGAPLAGVAVRCEPPRGSGRRSSTTTDGEGRFRCEHLAPTPFVLSFYASGDDLRARPAAKLWGIVPGGDEVLVRVSDAAIPSASITGTLLELDGQPPAEAHVQCSAEGLYWGARAEVDPHTGRFHIGPLCAGTYRLQASIGEPYRFSAWSEPIVLLAGEALDVGPLPVAEPGSIAIMVTGPNAEPVDGARVALEFATEWSGFLAYVTKTDKGMARIDDVPPGHYRIQVGGRDLPTIYTPVTVVAGEESEVELELPAGVECKIVLSQPTDSVPIHMTLLWKRDGVLHERWINNLETGAEITLTQHLAPGTWEVTIISETGRRSLNHFQVDIDDPPGREIPIRLP